MFSHSEMRLWQVGGRERSRPLVHLSNRIAFQSQLDSVQIEADQARADFLKWNLLLLHQRIDGSDADAQFAGKLAFGETFA